TFLWALAALAIPVIIHLFYFRRFRKVYFSNVSFLKEVKEETSARSRLRNLLVLLMRLLAIACLVFAFAQPFIPAEQEVARGRKAVSIYVDNSFSMQAESDQLPLLEMAKRRAKDIVRAYGVEDRFQLLSNDFSGKQQRLYGQEEVIDLIEELEIGPQTRLLSSVLARQEAALNLDNIPNKIAYQLSDFQRTVSDLNDDVDSTLQLNLVPLRAVRESNIAIDSVWFEAPVPLLNQNNSLLVRVRNYSDEAQEDLRLSLSYQGQTKPVGQLSIPARDYVLDTVNLNITEAGLGRAELRITDYPVEFDDSYLISFRTSEVLSVLNIHSGIADRRLAAALNGISVFAPDFLSAQQIDYGRLNEYQLIVLTDLTQISSGLANELKQYMENGGNVLLFPPQTADVQSYSSFLSSLPADRLANFEETRREVSSLNNDEFVFKGVFRNEGQALRLPTTQGNFTLNRQSAQPAEALMRYRDGQIALAKYRLNLGHLYLNTSPLDESVNNLGLNAEVFVPMLYKMAISAGRQRPESYTIGRDQLIETNRRQASAERVFRLSGNDGEFIPEQRIVGQRIFLSINEQLQQSGFYELLLDDSAPLDLFAFNFDRAESDLSYLSEEEIETLTAGKANILDGQNEAELIGTIQTNNEGQPLWRYFIWGVLIFLLVEVLLLRFWKT
ncbi:MAG: BatA domain-containing protein, partial [Bacteroidota bacterium]